MRVFIHYKTALNRETFEGSRLRKVLKGECEEAGVTWIDDIFAEPDIAHFLTPRDDAMAVDAAWHSIPIVVSAFYAENDPYASFLDPKKPKTPTITSRAMRLLNRADLVLVPNEAMKTLCVEQGVKSRIEIHEPCVNLRRFDNLGAEKDIFPRYFSIRDEKKIVLSTGCYEDRYIINAMKNIASCCPELDFYFFGSFKRHNPRWLIASYSRKCPSNLHFESLVQDDVFRSALYRADAFLALDAVHPDGAFVLDAFATKTQVVALHKNPLNDLLIPDKTGFVFDSIASIAHYLRSLYSKEAKSTIIPAYAMAERHSLQTGAKRLKELYASLLNR